MRVYNLTDVPTTALSARGLVNVPLKVGGVDIPPGEHRDVRSLGADEQTFLRCGALSVGEPPSWYRAQKALVPAPMPPPSPPEEPSSPPLVEVEVTVGPDEDEEPSEERPEEPTRIKRRKKRGR